MRRLRRGLSGREVRATGRGGEQRRALGRPRIRAHEKAEYEALLTTAAGFVDLSVESIHTYAAELVLGFLGPEGVGAPSVRIASIFVRARKPAE